jgi:hypothetical protein
MHNKFIVIDGRYVWTGSANFTGAARYDNNENMIIIDSEEIGKKYVQNFDTIKDNIFQVYIKDLANNQLAVWKNNLIKKYYEKSEHFRFKLRIMREAASYLNASQKSRIDEYFKTLKPGAAQSSSSSSSTAAPSPFGAVPQAAAQSSYQRSRPISASQIAELSNRGVNYAGLTYDAAYALIGKIWREEKEEKEAEEDYPKSKKRKFDGQNQ